MKNGQGGVRPSCGGQGFAHTPMKISLRYRERVSCAARSFSWDIPVAAGTRSSSQTSSSSSALPWTWLSASTWRYRRRCLPM